MRSRSLLLSAIALIGLLALPQQARADGFITPYLGTTFNSSFDDYDESTEAPEFDDERE